MRLKIIMVLLLSVFLAFQAHAFYGSFGKLRAVPWAEYRASLKELNEKWDQYTVYWIGFEKWPSAIMFDPTNDERKLVPHKWWDLVKSEEEFSSHMRWIRASGNFQPVLWRVLGPDNQFYGYIYSYWQNIRIDVVDGKTMWVDEAHMPPFDIGWQRNDP